jgi:hypothetical protein
MSESSPDILDKPIPPYIRQFGIRNHSDSLGMDCRGGGQPAPTAPLGPPKRGEAQQPRQAYEHSDL